MDVQQRAARIAWVDARVGLDQALIRHLFVERDIAFDRAHRAHRVGIFVAVGVADGDHRLQLHQVFGGAQRDGRQRLVNVDLQHGQVMLQIASHHPAGVA